MNRTDYESEIMNQLNDTNNYESLTYNPIPSIANNINDRLKGWLDETLLTYDEYLS